MIGSVIIKPLEAKLTRSVSAFSKMDPYCVGRYENINLKGQICKAGSMNPSWSESFIFGLNTDLCCFLEVKNKDVLTKDSIIGICQIELEKVKEEREQKKWYNLYYNQKIAGEIYIEAIYTEQKYTSRVVVYAQPKKVKESEETVSPTNKLSMTHTLSKHIPQDKDPKTDTKANEELKTSPKKNTNSPVKSEANTPSTEIKQETTPTKSNKNVKSPKKEKEAQKDQLSTSDPVNDQNTLKTEKPEKEKKKGLGFFKKFKKMFDNPNPKKGKANKDTKQASDPNLQSADDISAPLRRRKVGEGEESAKKIEENLDSQNQANALTENSQDQFILERKKPDRKAETQSDYDSVDKENSARMRGNYQTIPQADFKNHYEKDYQSYSESISRAKDLVSKVREQYDPEGIQTNSSRESRWREPVTNPLPESNSQDKERDIYVKEISSNDQRKVETQKGALYDKFYPSTNYAQTSGEALSRQNFKYR